MDIATGLVFGTVLSLVALVVAWHHASAAADARERAATAAVDLDRAREDAKLRERQLTRRANVERALMQEEIQRLTTAIIHMKEMRPNLGLSPEHTDERWGSYSITPELELQEMQRRAKEELSEDPIAEVDRELLEQLENF